ncbi:MAG: hypothetical protein K8U57_27015 [Planctomycetes bacterium]|nr:hypothetical protein [Planctomycetota bacterium]
MAVRKPSYTSIKNLWDSLDWPQKNENSEQLYREWDTRRRDASPPFPRTSYDLLLDVLPRILFAKTPSKKRTDSFWLNCHSQAHLLAADFGSSEITTKQYRDFLVSILAIEIRANPQLNNHLLNNLPWLYPDIPLVKDTDNTGWLVVADWLQERDGEPISHAIREAVAVRSEVAEEEFVRHLMSKYGRRFPQAYADWRAGRLV